MRAQVSCLEGGPLLWIWPLYLHVNKKSDDDDTCKSLSYQMSVNNEKTTKDLFDEDFLHDVFFYFENPVSKHCKP